ncbi:MAG: 50S ribosomal protein L29 [Bacteroidetes bacterium]|nr:50S ribosomal protein L29 [Bacteroidota bacterium]
MKNKDIKVLSDKDLKDTLKDERESYTKMKFTHAISQVESTARITATRKTIARLQTEKRSRQLNVQNEPKV